MKTVYAKFLGTLLLLASSAAAAPIEVKIGATLPLTGRLAVAGQDARHGIELAAKQFSTEEVVLVPIFDDNQHDPKLAATSANKLLSVDKVNVLISMWDMADVVAPLTEQKRVPHLAVRWDPGITKKYRYTFTFESTYQSYIDSLLKLLKASAISTVSVLAEESQGWLLATEYLLKHASESEINVVGDERYLPAESNYRDVVLRALRNKPQTVILLSNPPHTEALLKTVKSLAPTQKVTGYFEIIDPKLVAGVPFVAQFKVENWFAQRFKSAFGELPRSRAAQVYDMVHLIALAVTHTGKQPTPESLSAALSNFSSESGATGQLISNSDRVIESRCVWMTSLHGEFLPFFPPSNPAIDRD